MDYVICACGSLFWEGGGTHVYTISIVRVIRHCGEKNGSYVWTMFFVPVATGSGQIHVWAILFVLVAYHSGKGVLPMCILYPLCASFTAVKKSRSYVWTMLVVPVAIGSG